MSAHMKKLRTELRLKGETGIVYLVPKAIAEKYRTAEESISADDFFAPYDKEFSKPGMLLRGLRVREGYTQEQLAQLIDVTQANLSKMELGKRPIGKEMAKRIAKQFGINYQRLL